MIRDKERTGKATKKTGEKLWSLDMIKNNIAISRSMQEI